VVKGLDLFRKHFDSYADQFTLIGGTAFWNFVEAGGYRLRESSEAGKPVLYRFQKPANAAYPFMLELFCRSPDGMRLAESSQLTPIPLDESVSSLSAILLDDFYYRFILEGRRQVDGMSWIGEDRLIPLKAHAWLDLSERRARGESVDSKNIRKHGNDVIRLSQLLSPESRVPVRGKIREDLSRFLLQLTHPAPALLHLNGAAGHDRRHPIDVVVEPQKWQDSRAIPAGKLSPMHRSARRSRVPSSGLSRAAPCGRGGAFGPRS
jgi:hypothetical protein